MIGLEDTDLAKALAALGQQAPRLAAAIVTEETSPEGVERLADTLDQLAAQVRLYRLRAWPDTTPPVQLGLPPAG